MLLIILLQTTSQATPVAAYVTMGAAVLAALASLNATRVSAKTQREVAAQAAQTARDSARIAADTAREIKNQDYKFDFYKKIIERRLAAWADAEQTLMPLMASVVMDEKDDRKRLSFFTSPKRFAEMLERVNNAMIGQSFWIGGQYSVHLLEFRNLLLIISHQCHVMGQFADNGVPLVDRKKLYEEGAAMHDTLMAIHFRMASALLRQIIDLHDVESFLRSRVI